MNKLIKALIHGRLVTNGSLTFDRNRDAFFLEFRDGHIGVFGQSIKPTVYTYFEYSLVDDKIRQTPNKNPRLILNLGINEFFAGFLRNNVSLLEALGEEGAQDPSFIVTMHRYTAKKGLEENIDLTEYLFKPDQKAQLQAMQSQQATSDKRVEVKTKVKEIIPALRELIKTTIQVNQMNNLNVWTVHGVLALEIKGKLAQTSLLSDYSSARQQALLHGFEIESFTQLTQEALLGSEWKLNREVDLLLNPNLYLIPATFNFPKLLPAVGTDDPAVKLQ